MKNLPPNTKYDPKIQSPPESFPDPILAYHALLRQYVFAAFVEFKVPRKPEYLQAIIRYGAISEVEDLCYIDPNTGDCRATDPELFARRIRRLSLRFIYHFQDLERQKRRAGMNWFIRAIESCHYFFGRAFSPKRSPD